MLIAGPDADANKDRVVFTVVLPMSAVNVADWPEPMLAAVTVKLPLDDPAGTERLAGALTEELSLVRVIVAPPVGAAPLSVTEHDAVPGVLIDTGAQEIPDSAAGEAVGSRESVTEGELLAPVALSATLWFVCTAWATALNAALDDPAGTVTEAGILTAVLLVCRLTEKLLCAGEVSDTEQADVPGVVTDSGEHVSPTCGVAEATGTGALAPPPES